MLPTPRIARRRRRRTAKGGGITGEPSAGTDYEECLEQEYVYNHSNEEIEECNMPKDPRPIVRLPSSMITISRVEMEELRNGGFGIAPPTSAYSEEGHLEPTQMESNHPTLPESSNEVSVDSEGPIGIPNEDQVLVSSSQLGKGKEVKPHSTSTSQAVPLHNLTRTSAERQEQTRLVASSRRTVQADKTGVSGDPLQDTTIEPYLRETLEFYHRLHPDMLLEMHTFHSLVGRDSVLACLGKTLHNYQTLKPTDVTTKLYKEMIGAALDLVIHGINLKWMVDSLDSCRTHLRNPDILKWRQSDKAIKELHKKVKENKATLTRLIAKIDIEERKKEEAFEAINSDIGSGFASWLVRNQNVGEDDAWLGDFDDFS